MRFTIRSCSSGPVTSRKNCVSNHVTSRRISARLAAVPLIICALSTVSSKYSQIAIESISRILRVGSAITGVCPVGFMSTNSSRRAHGSSGTSS